MAVASDAMQMSSPGAQSAQFVCPSRQASLKQGSASLKKRWSTAKRILL
eukprot:CAMPEP_0172005284 /NCGR_PEP_ID=MMETSP1041-20130122/4961_1 /TAXON_ID=464988 /ORGANISM="Hemiselmis andersenii, Strain CCMP439" /LENGTH=48 /DNA_ID= /DNA_START= /DNA_END= /DNA_ORIENTATION=